MRRNSVRLMTAAGAALLVVALPACASAASSSTIPVSSTSAAAAAVSSSSSTPSSSAAAPVPTATTATVTSASVTPAALGPVPSSWEGGKSVLVAPRWQKTKNGPLVAWSSAWPKPVRFLPTHGGVFNGMVIALDPGHDIGNGTHSSGVNSVYWVGFNKICNTTGTATNSGYAEASYTFDVAARLRRLLTSHGATVVLTRDRNDYNTYGPCIGARGAFGKQENARFMVQIHADGGPGSGHGFHTIVPATNGKGNTGLTWKQDRVLAAAMIAGMKKGGFSPATYLDTPLQIRGDQGAMTVSQVPIVTVETLNMRNSGDAYTATHAAGRQKVALGLYFGILWYAAHR